MKSILIAVNLLTIFFASNFSNQAQDRLPSWNDGPAKQSIIKFVETTT